MDVGRGKKKENLLEIIMTGVHLRLGQTDYHNGLNDIYECIIM